MDEFETLPALVRPKEAARVTGLCARTLARLFDAGRLEGVVLHRQRRYTRAGLRALASGRQNQRPAK